jgi:hypothetical protein
VARVASPAPHTPPPSCQPPPGAFTSSRHPQAPHVPSLLTPKQCCRSFMCVWWKITRAVGVSLTHGQPISARSSHAAPVAPRRGICACRDAASMFQPAGLARLLAGSGWVVYRKVCIPGKISGIAAWAHHGIMGGRRDRRGEEGGGRAVQHAPTLAASGQRGRLAGAALRAKRKLIQQAAAHSKTPPSQGGGAAATSLVAKPPPEMARAPLRRRSIVAGS